MEKIIEGLSFDEGEATQSFQGNILGEKWNSIHVGMVQKIKEMQGHEQ